MLQLYERCINTYHYLVFMMNRLSLILTLPVCDFAWPNFHFKMRLY